MKTEPVLFDDILIGARHRPLSDAAVDRLVESISRVGLLTPITVHDEGERLWLVAGHHRLAAMKKLGWDMADAFVIYGDDIEIELREIAENLHREDLKALERDDHLARWIELTDVKVVSSQPETKLGRPEGGVRAAARELGVEKMDAHRAVKVASLSDEAKAAAVEYGLDDNRSALLAAAKEKDPAAQVASIVKRAERPKVKPAPDIIDDDDSDPDHNEGLRVIATRGFLNRARESASMARYPLGKLVVDDEILAAASDAAQSWNKLLERLSGGPIKSAADRAEARSLAVAKDNSAFKVESEREIVL